MPRRGALRRKNLGRASFKCRLRKCKERRHVLADPTPNTSGLAGKKVLTANDLHSLTALENRLLTFQDHYQSAAKPFQWRFTRRELVGDDALASHCARVGARTLAPIP